MNKTLGALTAMALLATLAGASEPGGYASYGTVVGGASVAGTPSGGLPTVYGIAPEGTTPWAPVADAPAPVTAADRQWDDDAAEHVVGPEPDRSDSWPQGAADSADSAQAAVYNPLNPCSGVLSVTNYKGAEGSFVRGWARCGETYEVSCKAVATILLDKEKGLYGGMCTKAFGAPNLPKKCGVGEVSGDAGEYTITC